MVDLVAQVVSQLVEQAGLDQGGGSCIDARLALCADIVSQKSFWRVYCS